MIVINLGGTDFEFGDFDSAIEFLMACRHRDENQEHIHDFTYHFADGHGLCICGEINYE